MITRDRKWLEEGKIETLLTGAVREFGQGQYRLERLARYREGSSDILTRERPEGLPNTRLCHGFARYISQVSAGYLLSEAVHYADTRCKPRKRRRHKGIYGAVGGSATQLMSGLLPDSCTGFLPDSLLHSAIWYNQLNTITEETC